MNLLENDEKILKSCIALENTKFMDSIIMILEKYGEAFSEDDIVSLTDKNKSREMFKHDYPILLEIDRTRDKKEQIHISGNYRYYAKKECKIKGKEYFYSSQLYGFADAKSHGDNRTPLWKWVCKKVGVSTESVWLPALSDYSPGINKEKWLDLLKDQSVFDSKSLKAMACMYDNGGEGACSELGKKYNQNMTLWRTTCGVHLATRIAEATGCRKIQESGKTVYYVIPFLYRKTSSDEIGSCIYKLRPELYDALTEFDILRFLPEKEGEDELDIKETIKLIKDYIASNGFSYNDDLIENFYLSLKSKPFVILAGTSGTGKTRLVKLFAEAIGATEENDRYKLVSVRPDWSDSSDLFGHINLQNEFVDGEITEFISNAIKHKNEPYFLCLDEMNLARVEYYLSDYLSIIESRKRVDDEIKTNVILKASFTKEKYTDLYLPENLYVIGTVNMDETTFPFSKKVLDRANTIEFSYVDLVPEFTEIEEHEALELGNEFLKTKYVVLRKDIEETDQDYVKNVSEKLQEINEILVDANAHVGYRVRDEIAFYMLNNLKTGLLSEEEAFDNEIMQKILPRIQGSGKATQDLLIRLFKKFAGNESGISEDKSWIEMKKYIEPEKDEAGNVKKSKCTYPKSAEKICYMMRRLEEDGFTSYWI